MDKDFYTDITYVCPKCKQEVLSSTYQAKCECGWEGRWIDLMTKRITYKMPEVEKIEYER